MPLSRAQYDQLRKPLNATRIAKRSQGGKQLSYLESWDVRAHLIRIFGYGNFDVETLDAYHVETRAYGTEERPMVEVIWYCKVRLTVHDLGCTYIESAVGSTSGPANMLGEHHDNAVKTAASDAMKRCAINLGTQFGLSLYDDGNTKDVVRGTLVEPDGESEEEAVTDEQAQNLARSLGATVVTVEPNVDHTETVQA